MLFKNLLPNPAPSEAPLTMPAISTNSICINAIMRVVPQPLIIRSLKKIRNLFKAFQDMKLTEAGTTFNELLIIPSLSSLSSSTLTIPIFGSKSFR
jgi:hypothetical protein